MSAYNHIFTEAGRREQADREHSAEVMRQRRLSFWSSTASKGIDPYADPLPNTAFHAEVEAKIAKSNADLAKRLKTDADEEAAWAAAGHPINPNSAYYIRK